MKASLILLPLLGLTWVFGLFAVNENTVVFAWLFTIFNSLQASYISICIGLIIYLTRCRIADMITQFCLCLGCLYLHTSCREEPEGEHSIHNMHILTTVWGNISMTVHFLQKSSNFFSVIIGLGKIEENLWLLLSHPFME